MVLDLGLGTKNLGIGEKNMISNQILQSTMEGLKTITRVDLCVMDTEGNALASTFDNAEQYAKAVLDFVNSPADSQVLTGVQFFKVFDEHQLGICDSGTGRQRGCLYGGKDCFFPDSKSSCGL